MPRPMAICLEDLRASSPSDRFLRCVAVPGRQPGLGLGADGLVVWKDDQRLACELWVSADDRLIAYRRSGAPELVVRRAGRSLSAPSGKPVVLCDQDELEVGGRCVRVHVHGNASTVHAPSPLVQRAGAAVRVAAVAAAAMVLTAAAGCDKNKDKAKDGGSIEVREMPPTVAPEPMSDASPEEAAPGSGDAADARAAEPLDAAPDTAADARADGSARAKPKPAPAPIDVRERPPDPIE